MLQDNVTITARRFCHPPRMVTMSQKEFQRVKVIENAAGAAAETPLSARFRGLGAAWQSWSCHALGGFTSPEAVDLDLGSGQVCGLQRLSSGGKTFCRGEPLAQPGDRASHLTRCQTGFAAEAPASQISLPTPAPPAFRHDGPHRC